MFFGKKLDVAIDREALAKIAHHIGLDLGVMPSNQAADHICARIDELRTSGDVSANVAAGPAQELRSISDDIRAIELSGTVDVILTQGNEAKMEVFANSPVGLSKLKTKIKGTSLVIGDDSSSNIVYAHSIQGSIVRKHNQESLGLRAEITLPHVTHLKISGAGDIQFRHVECEHFTAKATGAGSLEIGGKVNHFDARVSGAGDINAYKLLAKKGVLDVSGAGNIYAHIEQSVSADASGAGTIKISGNPTERDTSSSGAGEIKFVKSK